MSWLTQFFLNPTFVVPGAALALIPIAIHLLSRLRYRKVRFAAMEFLLQSDELNRRRLIIEQLLLLFLRVLAILLIMLLIARLVLDPSRLMLLRGATTHHVLILDDTLSMRQRTGDSSVFEQALATLQNMISQGGNSPGSLRATVLTMSQPDRPLITDRALDNALIQDLIPRLQNLSCSYRSALPPNALMAALNILSGDGGVAPQVHVLTDLRASDWINQPEVVAAFKELDRIDAQVNLIQVTSETQPNVALTKLESETLATAVGVPWRLNLTCRNFGTQKVTQLRADVLVDGNSLPGKILLPDIEAGSETLFSHDISFEASGWHQVEVRLESDLLPEDNSRFIVAEVTDRRAILIVDDEARQEDAGYVAAALSADPQLTGLAPEVRTSDVLTTQDISRYDCIYLLNVRELPADAVQLLKKYVAAGGGLAWFLDDQANTSWYSTAVRSEGAELFPVTLGTVQSIPPVEQDAEPQFQSPVFEDHPIFAIYNDPELPFADAIQVSRWFECVDQDQIGKATKILARLKNGAPVIFEHALGEGRIVTFLMSAGRRWSNWPIMPAAPGYVVMHLLMHQYLQKPTDLVQLRELGDPVRLEWPISDFTESVEVFLPADVDDQQVETSFLRLQAAPVTELNAKDSSDAEGEERLAVSVPQADHPGVYRIRRFRPQGPAEEIQLALSVPTTESDLATADASRIEHQGGIDNVRVFQADVAGRLAASDAGREMRWLLFGLLILVLVCEQLLSLRLSFHPEVKS